jgi:formamidopyrimidine-DNA glycosylase
MAELPDVATLKRYFDATALHQEITGVEVRDERLLDGLTAAELERGLAGHAFAATRRHGKVLFALLDADDDGALALHFGMTGSLRTFERADAMPEHARVLIRFANGYRLALISQRLLGGMALTDDADAFIAERGLGPDALNDLTDEDALRRALAGHGGMLKPTLTNQAIVAGIGNLYVDEMLFQARLDPRMPADELDDHAFAELFAALRRVLETAVERDADPAEFPPDWITRHREHGATCPRCGGEIERLEVSGRGTYWCPACQGGTDGAGGGGA